jgi:hypothetical protein
MIIYSRPEEFVQKLSGALFSSFKFKIPPVANRKITQRSAK